jgi:hypothetical protein
VPQLALVEGVSSLSLCRCTLTIHVFLWGCLLIGSLIVHLPPSVFQLARGLGEGNPEIVCNYYLTSSMLVGMCPQSNNTTTSLPGFSTHDRSNPHRGTMMSRISLSLAIVFE